MTLEVVQPQLWDLDTGAEAVDSLGNYLNIRNLADRVRVCARLVRSSFVCVLCEVVWKSAWEQRGRLCQGCAVTSIRQNVVSIGQ